MRIDGFESQRSEPRYAYPKMIEYGRCSGSALSSGRAIVSNISRSGMCLYTYDQPHVGDNFVISSPLPVPHRSYEIMWTRMISEDFFQAGLRSTDRTH